MEKTHDSEASQEGRRVAIRIGIDLMGSDRGPIELFQALVQIEAPCTLVAIAPEGVLPPSDKIEFVAASEVIEMNEPPLLAVRRKKDSSMAVGSRLLKEGKIDALVSTGNTGALIATALFHLNRLPSVDRPALLALLPTAVRGVAVLDVGANLYPKPHHLIDFARIGIAYRRAAHGIEDAKVGLLNIGVEEEKGTAQLKEGYTLLQKELGGAFLGNVEGREVYEGKVDVLVTDGFTGNVFLKTSEGVSSFLVDYLKKHFGSKAGGEVAQELHTQFNYAQYPGALLAGLDGVVIKCHGHSNVSALKSGIQGAIDLVQKNLISKMHDLLS